MLFWIGVGVVVLLVLCALLELSEIWWRRTEPRPPAGSAFETIPKALSTAGQSLVPSPDEHVLHVPLKHALPLAGGKQQCR